MSGTPEPFAEIIERESKREGGLTENRTYAMHAAIYCPPKVLFHLHILEYMYAR